jgi:hypothetical protein
MMEQSKEEDLKKLSERTEELLTRLNDLSSTLNTQLKSPGSSMTKPKPITNTDTQANSEKLITANGSNYYSIPVNTQFLEKREQHTQTQTSNGFMTTKRTAIFTEQHHVQSPNQETVQPFQIEGSEHFEELAPPVPSSESETNIAKAFINQERPSPARKNTAPRQQVPNTQFQTVNFDSIAKPYKKHQAPPKKKPEPSFEAFQHSQQSNYEPIGQTQYSDAITDAEAKTYEIANKLAAQNKEIKDRLSKYSTRINIGSQMDNLKLFAWLVLIFSPIAPFAVIKDDFLLAIGCSCLALFFGIFFCMMALRLVEVSELVRWAHNQVVQLETKIDEIKNNQ